MIFTWQTKEYAYYPKGYIWNLVFSIISLSTIILIIFWLKNYFLAILITISLIIFYIMAHKKPNQITIHISSKGIKVGRSFFPYKNIQSFWIIYQPQEEKELFLKLKALLTPDIKILIDDQSPVQLRHFLLEYIPEKEYTESFLDLILKIIRY
ncbi:MAG TPA: hypothetical protein ENL06_02115 [Candidatus Portnoybacteria bacterium]|nr:hypothetical protein [Candidatus Portnoybacteria bacterium]